MKRIKTTNAILVLLLAVIPLAIIPGCKKKNKPPDPPTIPTGSSNGSINTPYSFFSSCTDPDNDSVALRFDWGDSVSGWSPFVASGDSVSVSHSWANPDTYYVKAQARDKNEATSSWSGSYSIAIVRNRPPNPPAMPSGPPTGHKDSLYVFSAITTDPDGDGICYRFDWGNGDTSDWSSWLPSGQPSGAVHSWPRAGAFNVRAQAKDVNEATSSWSNPHLATIDPNPAPP